MDFKFTEEQELLAASLIEFMDREFPESLMKECDENHRFPEEANRKFFEAGFGTIGIPEEYGGTPADMVTMCMVMEIVHRYGWRCVRYTPLAFTSMLEFGSEEQKAKYLPNLAKGIHRSAFGITEPGAGSDSSALATTYQRRNGKVYINGNKSFMTNAVNCKYMLCVARNADDDPNLKENRSRFSMWWVQLHDDDGKLMPGVTMEPLEKIGWNMGNTCELHLQDVELEEKDLVGVEGNGFMQAMVNFEVERLIACAQSLGAAECAYEDAVRYATQRIQFGRPIGANQLIQEHITEMYMKIENMRNWVYKTAWKIDNGESVQIDSAVAKLYCGRAAFEVCDTAMQVMGGIGYTKDCRISRLWRDQRVYRIGAGTDEIMIHIAGRAIQKQYK